MFIKSEFDCTNMAYYFIVKFTPVGWCDPKDFVMVRSRNCRQLQYSQAYNFAWPVELFCNLAKCPHFLPYRLSCGQFHQPFLSLKTWQFNKYTVARQIVERQKLIKSRCHVREIVETIFDIFLEKSNLYFVENIEKCRAGLPTTHLNCWNYDKNQIFFTLIVKWKY